MIAVGSHDTASAVVGVPATTKDFAYVSSGTWSLVGLELDEPVLTEDARAANFTNEIGVDHRTRFLKNVGGLWVLQECMREWQHDDIDDLVAQAGKQPSGGPLIDIDDPMFIAPGAMPTRVAAAAGIRHASPEWTTRCILDSLAAAYARTLLDARELSGASIDVIHVVGGGSRNALLCQLTANATSLPVIAGPAEATALGNIAIQARAHGALPAALDDIRAGIARGAALRRFEPS